MIPLGIMPINNYLKYINRPIRRIFPVRFNYGKFSRNFLEISASIQNIQKYSISATQSHSKITNNFKVGSEITGFQVTRIKSIPELQLTAVCLQHLKTGADYLHIARDDPNNVFCVGFRTTPMDSTGVPHILEHLALCGSKRYPCRDPFFKMLNRSLATFMNAMTGSDYTIYPFSTQHPTDFRNLMEVYLDAVFTPNLTELDFLQEGWRLEHADPNDRNSPIVLKGVVFNEMKGVFADNQHIFYQKLQNALFPSHTYSYISGGDPLAIPHLTWKGLRDFHAQHYHPGNSRFFTYGNQPLENHLCFINESYLDRLPFGKIYPNTYVPDEPRWTEPRREHIHCGVDQMAQKTRQSSLAVSYLLTDIQDVTENFTISIICDLLLNGPNAPFYKSLIESQYGTSFSAGSGYNGHTRTTSFTVGLQGIANNLFDEVEETVEKTFAQTISGGFPRERIDAVIHNIELGLKHQTTSFGLNLALSLTPIRNHGGDPLSALEINKNIDYLKKSLNNNSHFLQDKLSQYFTNNKHKLTLSMSPDEEFESKLQKAESELLQNKLTNLTDMEKENIWHLSTTLKLNQEKKEDISCLPTLVVSDISRNISPALTKHFKLNGSIPLQLCEQPTNGVTYLRIILDTKGLPEHLRELLPLFCAVLTKMGAADLDFRAFSQQEELVSGGLSTCIHITEHPENLAKYEEGILLSSHCLQSNLLSMLDLWRKVLNEIRLDDISRFTSLVNMFATEEANNLVDSGHKYAMSYAASSTGFVSHLKEQWSGLTFLQKLKQLSESPDLSDTLSKLNDTASVLLRNRGVRVALNTSPEIADEAVKMTEIFLKDLNGMDSNDSIMTDIPSSFTPHTCRTHHVFPFPVNFTAKSYACLPYSHPDTAALRVLSRLMFQFLHREIREKGGAYGGGASAGPGGPFCFYSYRDPHSVQTLGTFDEAVEWVLSGNFTPQDVHEAKLGVFQSVDAPVAPGSKGMRRFLTHVTDEMFNAHRHSILDAEEQDLIRVCRIYLREAVMEGCCLIGPQNEMLEKDPFWVTQMHA